MTAIVWDTPGERTFQTGIDRGVLYLNDGVVVAWNGLTNVEESSSSEQKSFYLNGIKYLECISPGDFSGILNAITYPDEFDSVIGIAQVIPGVSYYDQPSKSFGLSYRTRIGDDILGTDLGYKVHILYNILANPDNRSFETLGESSQISAFSWNLRAIPVRISGYRPTAHISIDSRKVSPETLTVLENILYGTESSGPYLPPIDELVYVLSGGTLEPRLNPSDFSTPPLRLYNLISSPLVDRGSQHQNLTSFGNPESTDTDGTSLNGTSQYLSATDSELPVNFTSHSYGIRFKTTQNSDDYRALITWYANHSLILHSGYLFTPNGVDLGVQSSNIDDDLWHFAVIVIKSSLDEDDIKLRLYIDGELVDSNEISAFDSIFEDQPFLYIGTDIYPSEEAMGIFVGNLKDAFVCDYALTDEEVMSLYEKISS